MSHASSPHSTTSAVAAQGGTLSPPPTCRKPTISAARRTMNTANAMIARWSSPKWCSACGTAGTMTHSCATVRRGVTSIPPSCKIEPQGRAFLGARSAECGASAAGPAGDLPGRLIGCWARTCGAHGGSGVHSAAHTGGRAGFYADLKGRLRKYGRSPEHLKVMPGLNPIVGRTEREAEEKHQYLQSLIQPEVGLELLSNALADFDLRRL